MNTQGDTRRELNGQSDTQQSAASRRAWLRSPWVLGLLAGVSLSGLMFLVLVTFLAPASQTPPSPQPTAQSFCADLVTRHYDAAYGLLSTAQQAQGTEAQFTASQRELDTLQGPVTQCVSTVEHVGATQASATLRVTRGAKSASGALTLVLQGSSWRVESYDTSVI